METHHALILMWQNASFALDVSIKSKNAIGDHGFYSSLEKIMRYFGSICFSVVVYVFAASAACAQSIPMQPIKVGDTFVTSEGNTLRIVRFKAMVSGNKCKTEITTANVANGYTIVGTTSYDAEQKDGGTLCKNGSWEGTGQDGRRFTRGGQTDLFIKSGKYYRVLRS